MYGELAKSTAAHNTRQCFSVFPHYFHRFQSLKEAQKVMKFLRVFKSIALAVKSINRYRYRVPDECQVCHMWMALSSQPARVSGGYIAVCVAVSACVWCGWCRSVWQRVYLIYICMTLLPNEMSKANKAK